MPSTFPAGVSCAIYSHVAGEGHLRAPQVRALLDEWSGMERTVVMGDFNSTPGDTEILLIEDSGLRDAFVASKEGSQEENIVGKKGYTAPADDPSRRIDYIWVSSDLKERNFSLTGSLASDHLSAAVTVE